MANVVDLPMIQAVRVSKVDMGVEIKELQDYKDKTYIYIEIIIRKYKIR